MYSQLGEILDVYFDRTKLFISASFKMSVFYVLLVLSLQHLFLKDNKLSDMYVLFDMKN